DLLFDCLAHVCRAEVVAGHDVTSHRDPNWLVFRSAEEELGSDETAGVEIIAPRLKKESVGLGGVRSRGAEFWNDHQGDRARRVSRLIAGKAGVVCGHDFDACDVYARRARRNRCEISRSYQ